jgi:hypothetical protein
MAMLIKPNPMILLDPIGVKRGLRMGNATAFIFALSVESDKNFYA